MAWEINRVRLFVGRDGVNYTLYVGPGTQQPQDWKPDRYGLCVRVCRIYGCRMYGCPPSGLERKFRSCPVTLGELLWSTDSVQQVFP